MHHRGDVPLEPYRCARGAVMQGRLWHTLKRVESELWLYYERHGFGRTWRARFTRLLALLAGGIKPGLL